MLDQIGVELAGPAHPALEEGELQVREAASHPTKEECLAHCLASRGKVANVVVDEVRRRVAQSKPSSAGVEGRRYAELDALGPHGIVVVLAVDAEHVEPDGSARRLRMLPSRRNRAAHHAGHQDDFEAELPGHELELLDGLFRSVHRDHGGRRETICDVGEVLGGEDVERAGGGTANLAVSMHGHSQAGGRIHDAEVEAELAHPFVQKLRHQRRRPVSRVPGREGPERLLPDPPLLSLRQRHRELAPDHLRKEGKALQGLVPADLPEPLADQRPELEPVAIRVDDGMTELRSKLCCTCTHTILLTCIQDTPGM